MLKLENYRETINKCAHCGYCQATCPVYLEDLLESHVARNRLNLINQVLILGSMPSSQRFKEIVDRCLLCTNCTQTCSSKVPVDEIIIAARAEIGKGKGLKGFVMSKMLQQRGLTGLMSKAGSLVQKMGVAAKQMPQLASKSFDQIYSGTIPAQGDQRGRVAYFVGCGTNFLFPDTGIAVVDVLTRNGWEVVIPAGQVCCGIPAISEGDLAGARDMVATNLKLFDPDNVEAVITDCTSCGMMIKEKYSKLLEADDPLQEKAQALAGKIFEITDFLQLKGLSAAPGSLNQSFTYHVPCHRGWSPTVADAPRNLLGSLPGAELRELEEPERCCGAAGTFFLQHRDLSESIRSRRLEQIEASQADTVITQCPVCRFYLSAGLESQQVTHPVILLSQAYNTVSS
ncbi:MAG TPA: (Fe-S)-binding protein [Syntrophomonadaceae bacterium]|nr:(Fe-S)-binding protein [Syntrophomonadaceae bacterium]HQE23653.1 (Fe-S)-binding protein [Syntrophomonadaceae bacterium]